jgi:hypothetical protein
METFMNHTFARIGCALALSSTTGCANLVFSYVQDSVLPIVVQDVGSNCETDDPVDTDIARVHVEQEGDVCVITGDAVVLSTIEYADLEESFDAIDLQGENTRWTDGGFCWRPATDSDDGQPYEKCDFGPTVKAEWRRVGDDAWMSDPEFPAAGTADVEIAYHHGSIDKIEYLVGLSRALAFSTTGANFPAGRVTLDDSEFFDRFNRSVDDEQDLDSVVHARVEVPMSVIAEFTEYEYRISFAYQMYVAGRVENESFWEIFFEGLLPRSP